MFSRPICASSCAFLKQFLLRPNIFKMNFFFEILISYFNLNYSMENQMPWKYSGFCPDTTSLVFIWHFFVSIRSKSSPHVNLNLFASEIFYSITCYINKMDCMLIT